MKDNLVNESGGLVNDCISRQAAIDALGERPMVWVGDDYELGARNQYDADVLALETVPFAQPQRMRGRWKLLPGRDDEHIRYLHCSVCHFNGDYESNFCPNCGADMRGEQDD